MTDHATAGVLHQCTAPPSALSAAEAKIRHKRRVAAATRRVLRSRAAH